MTKRTDPERMRQLGRAGGLAAAAARRKRRDRTFLDALSERVKSNPDALVDQLLGTAAGAVVAARVLERAGELGIPEPKKEHPHPHPSAIDPTLGDLVELARSLGAGHHFGLEEAAGAGEANDSQTGEGSPENAGVPPAFATRNDYPSEAAAPDPENAATPDAAENGLESHEPSPPPRYRDLTANGVHKNRLRLGLPTGHPLDPYLAPGDELGGGL